MVDKKKFNFCRCYLRTNALITENRIYFFDMIRCSPFRNNHYWYKFICVLHKCGNLIGYATRKLFLTIQQIKWGSYDEWIQWVFYLLLVNNWPYLVRISSSRAVYEVNLHGANDTEPGPSYADNRRVRLREQTSPTPGKSLVRCLKE